MKTTKTDIELQKDVMAELQWDVSLDAAKIGVEVADGVVTLAGHVRSYAEKHSAEKATQRVAGVRAIAMALEVALPGTSVRTDSDIASAAQRALAWNLALPESKVKVSVTGGVVTLTGEVDWAYQRDVAGGAVRYLLGVKGVNDQIVLRSRATGATVKADIEAALKRRATDDGQHLGVTVDKGVVTLTGLVHSWSEADLARNSAWGSAGVTRVVDQMQIQP
jgi:osmotically-inducible protein OsmY